MASDDSVTRIEHDGRTIVLVGTAHVSKRSVEQVREVIEQEKPDTVCVELDPMRYEALTDEDRWKKLDLFQVIRQGKVPFLMASLMLSSHQRRMGEKLGVMPGAELLAAVDAAKGVDAEVVLADRNIQTTLKRTWANLSFGNKVRLAQEILAAAVGAEEEDEESEAVTAEKIEALKDSDVLSDMMNEFAEALPEVKEPLIDERDMYLMSKIREAPGKLIVAVVGAGHVKGMLKRLEEPVDRDKLDVIPPPTLFWRVFKWLIPLIILSAFSFGYYKHSGEDFTNLLYAWALPNAIAAAIFAIVAGARALSVMTAFVASPITSLNPTIGAGMVAGLVEAHLRRPTVADCENIHEDIKSLRGFYRNPFLRVLLVVILASLGSALGAWIGATWVISLL